MRRRLCQLLVIAALVAMSNLSLSAGMISDFDDGTVQGWVADYPLTPVEDGSQGTNWSLRLDRPIQPADQTFNSSFKKNIDWADIVANTRLELDVRASGSDVPGGWLLIHPALNSETGGWVMADLTIDLNGQWATYTWDYPAQPADPGNWAELFLNVNASWDQPVTLYVDQVRAVPEPSAIVLLGLGLCGLTVIGRRRLARRRTA